VNVTANGAEPEVGVPLNAATGTADALETQRQKMSNPAITQIRSFAFISEHPFRIKYCRNKYVKIYYSFLVFNF
jgi:hypothetical protein